GRHDVEVVVDGDGRPALDRTERAEHHRGSIRDAVDVCPATERPDGGEAELGATLQIRLAVGLRGDARDLDEILQQLLEAASFPLRELLDLLPGHGHGTPPCWWESALGETRNIGAEQRESRQRPATIHIRLT